MTLNIATAAIFLPAITLLMLAYTNRFLALSQLIRALHRDYIDRGSVNTLKQISHLKIRVLLIRIIQSLGALSIIFCTLSILSLVLNYNNLGDICFFTSLGFFLGSLISSLTEILMSSQALNILLSDIK